MAIDYRLAPDAVIQVSPNANVARIHPDVRSRLTEIARVANKEGLKILVNSAYRSPGHNTALQQQWDSGNRMGLKARPGDDSDHLYGLALDIDTNNRSRLTQLFQQHGFRWGGPNDHVHYSWGNADGAPGGGDSVSQDLTAFAEALHSTAPGGARAVTATGTAPPAAPAPYDPSTDMAAFARALTPKKPAAGMARVAPRASVAGMGDLHALEAGHVGPASLTPLPEIHEFAFRPLPDQVALHNAEIARQHLKGLTPVAAKQSDAQYGLSLSRLAGTFAERNGQLAATSELLQKWGAQLQAAAGRVGRMGPAERQQYQALAHRYQANLDAWKYADAGLKADQAKLVGYAKAHPTTPLHSGPRYAEEPGAIQLPQWGEWLARNFPHPFVGTVNALRNTEEITRAMIATGEFPPLPEPGKPGSPERAARVAEKNRVMNVLSRLSAYVDDRGRLDQKRLQHDSQAWSAQYGRGLGPYTGPPIPNAQDLQILQSLSPWARNHFAQFKAVDRAMALAADRAHVGFGITQDMIAPALGKLAHTFIADPLQRALHREILRRTAPLTGFAIRRLLAPPALTQRVVGAAARIGAHLGADAAAGAAVGGGLHIAMTPLMGEKLNAGDVGRSAAQVAFWSLIFGGGGMTLGAAKAHLAGEGFADRQTLIAHATAEARKAGLSAGEAENFQRAAFAALEGPKSGRAQAKAYLKTTYGWLAGEGAPPKRLKGMAGRSAPVTKVTPEARPPKIQNTPYERTPEPIQHRPERGPESTEEFIARKTVDRMHPDPLGQDLLSEVHRRIIQGRGVPDVNDTSLSFEGLQPGGPMQGPRLSEVGPAPEGQPAGQMHLPSMRRGSAKAIGTADVYPQPVSPPASPVLGEGPSLYRSQRLEPLSPEDAKDFAGRWNDKNPHWKRAAKLKRLGDKLAKNDTELGMGDPELGHQLHEAADQLRGDLAELVRRSRMTPEQLAGRAGPDQPSIWRRLSDAQKKKLPDDVKRILLLQDLSNSTQTIQPGAPPRLSVTKGQAETLERDANIAYHRATQVRAERPEPQVPPPAPALPPAPEAPAVASTPQAALPPPAPTPPPVAPPVEAAPAAPVEEALPPAASDSRDVPRYRKPGELHEFEFVGEQGDQVRLQLADDPSITRTIPAGEFAQYEVVHAKPAEPLVLTPSDATTTPTPEVKPRGRGVKLSTAKDAVKTQGDLPFDEEPPAGEPPVAKPTPPGPRPATPTGEAKPVAEKPAAKKPTAPKAPKKPRPGPASLDQMPPGSRIRLIDGQELQVGSVSGLGQQEFSAYDSSGAKSLVERRHIAAFEQNGEWKVIAPEKKPAAKKTKAPAAYTEAKRSYPDHITLAKEGDHYTAYGEDAKTIADTLNRPVAADGTVKVPTAEASQVVAALGHAGKEVALTQPPLQKAPRVKVNQAKLPPELQGAAPRYAYRDKKFTLKFATDLDRALYTLAQTTPSKADSFYMRWARAIFPEADPELIRAAGREVKETIKELAKEAPESGELSVPASRYSKGLSPGFKGKPGFIRLFRPKSKPDPLNQKPPGVEPKHWEAFSRDRVKPEPTAFEEMKALGDKFLAKGVRKWHELTRTYPELARNGKNAILHQKLRELSAGHEIAANKALISLHDVVYKLKPEQFGWTQWIVYIRDLAEEADIQAAKAAKGERVGGIVKPYTPEGVRAERANTDKLMAADPQVKKAVETYRRVMDEASQTLKDAYKRSEGKELKWDRKEYFPHQVLFYTIGKELGLYGSDGPPITKPRPSGNMRARFGTEDLPHNANLLEATFATLSTMYRDAAIYDFRAWVKETHDVWPKIQAEAEAASKVEGRVVGPEEILRTRYPEHTLYHDEPGTLFHRAHTFSDKLTQQILESAGQQIEITGQKGRKGLGVRFEDRSMAIPKALADTMRSMQVSRNNTPEAVIDGGMEWAVRHWKGYILMNPLSVVGYNFRNLTGDFEAVATGAPAALFTPSGFRRLAKAEAEIKQFMGAGKKLTPDLREWLLQGGAATTRQSVDALGRPDTLQLLSKYQQQPSAAKKLERALTLRWNYTDIARKLTDMREAKLRYTAYLYYRDAIVKNGKPPNYGASLRAEIDALPTPQQKAFQLSLDLLGNYNEIPAAFREMRKSIAPFISWEAANRTRFWRIWKNTYEDGGTLAWAARRLPLKVAGHAGKLATRPIVSASLASAAFLGKTAWMGAMLNGFNALHYPDLEADLSDEIRSRPHLIIGIDPLTKNAIVWTRLGAASDLFNSFGLESADGPTSRWLNGEESAHDILTRLERNPRELLIDIGKKWLGNEVAQMNPLYKVAFNMVGQDLWPDPTAPTPVRDKWEKALGMLKLDPLWRWYQRRPNSGIAPVLAGAVGLREILPGMGSYADLMHQARDFQGKRGGGGASEASVAAYYAKLAYRYGDGASFTKHILEYMEALVQATGPRTQIDAMGKWEASLKKLDPFAGWEEADIARFLETQKGTQRQQVVRGMTHLVRLFKPDAEIPDSTNLLSFITNARDLIVDGIESDAYDIKIGKPKSPDERKLGDAMDETENRMYDAQQKAEDAASAAESRAEQSTTQERPVRPALKLPGRKEK